jgi:hypothetical protein
MPRIYLAVPAAVAVGSNPAAGSTGALAKSSGSFPVRLSSYFPAQNY